MNETNGSVLVGAAVSFGWTLTAFCEIKNAPAELGHTEESNDGRQSFNRNTSLD